MAGEGTPGGVTLAGISKAFGGPERVLAIDDLSLEVAPGELLVLLGPSGCGKTTTLRCIAGLEEPDDGRILIDGRSVFEGRARSVPPAKRGIGMVFQSYALWPNKTVRGNIAYPLRAQRLRGGLRDGWVEQAAALVDCSHLLDRYPGQLSGGQQQRVALARGLVARPKVLLFDEPLSNLDAKLRDQVRGELHALHRELAFTSVYVTHDQHEAMAIGDRLAVMRAGRLEQADTPPRVFEHPATEYVADFVGYADAIELRRAADGWDAPAGSVGGVLPPPVDDVLHVRIRPEDLELHPPDAVPTERLWLAGARVQDVSFAGRSTEVLLDAGEARLRATVPTSSGVPEPGAEVVVAVDPDRARAFRPDGAAVEGRWSTTDPLVRAPAARR